MKTRPAVVAALALVLSAHPVGAQGPSDAPSASTPAPRPLALVGATLVDPARQVHAPGMTVLVEEGTIRAVFPAGERELPEGTEVLDFEGRYVIPGIIEAHTHLMRRFTRSREVMYAELERMLSSGVVALRDMAGDARVIAEARRNVLAGERLGPDIYGVAVMGGPEFAATDPRMARSSLGYEPGESPWAQAVTPETDLSLAVARAAGAGATGLKLYLGFDAETISALAEEAHRQGLEVWAHATVFPTRPLDVVRAGVDAISHACGVAWQDADLDPAPYAGANVEERPRFDPAVVDADSPEMTALFEEMARRGTVFDPTLSAHARPGDDVYGCSTDLMIALTRAAHRAGVTLATGTDWFTPSEDPYPAVHREIEALVDHGVLTPAEALAAATLGGARALGRESDYGTVEPGKIASLVVLREDPVQDVRALRTVVTVVHRGVLHPRTE